MKRIFRKKFFGEEAKVILKMKNPHITEINETSSEGRTTVEVVIEDEKGVEK